MLISIAFSDLAHAEPFNSIATLFGHVPWLGVYVGKIPAATGNLSILLNRCAECAATRVKKGSAEKDLFYYLVRRTRSWTPAHVLVRCSCC